MLTQLVTAVAVQCAQCCGLPAVPWLCPRAVPPPLELDRAPALQQRSGREGAGRGGRNAGQGREGKTKTARGADPVRASPSQPAAAVQRSGRGLRGRGSQLQLSRTL